MKTWCVLLAVLLLLATGASLFTRWKLKEETFAPKDVPPFLEHVAVRINKKHSEYRTNTFWWSFAFHGSLLGAAFLSAASGIILKIESVGEQREKLKKDIAAICAGSAALLLTISGTMNFNRKWESNRVAGYQAENLLYEISTASSNDLPRAYRRLQEIVARQNEGILGQQSVSTNSSSEAPHAASVQ